METSFFQRGRGNTQFYFVATELARVLAKRAKFPPLSRIWSEYLQSPDVAIDVRAGLTGIPADNAGPVVSGGTLAATRRKIYLSKPTADTQTDYLRLHKALTDHGFEVVPTAAEYIPAGQSQSQCIDEALADAVASIHLIGKLPNPNLGMDDDTVSVQLFRAADKAIRQNSPSSSSHAFRRVIWAPRIFDGTERDPIDTFRLFAPQLPSDRIESDTISRFIESLLLYLDNFGPDQRPTPVQFPDGEVYLCHDKPDEDYAFEIAKILAEANIDYVLPPYANTSEQDRTRSHKDSLAKCSTVIMCWAHASELWARAQSKELANWRYLERKQQFDHRALIAGPPPDTRKEDKRLRLLFPTKEIDVLVNSMTTEQLPEAIKSIFAADTNALP